MSVLGDLSDPRSEPLLQMRKRTPKVASRWKVDGEGEVMSPDPAGRGMAPEQPGPVGDNQALLRVGVSPRLLTIPSIHAYICPTGNHISQRPLW